jgi:hypothetical protein
LKDSWEQASRPHWVKAMLEARVEVRGSSLLPLADQLAEE